MNEEKLTYGTGYENYLYTGIQGLIMKLNHKHLSKNIDKKVNRLILEIGGGAKPHNSIVNLNGINEYWISDTKSVIEDNKENYSSSYNFHYIDEDLEYKNLIKSKKKFTRIIVSHVWEHLPNPELFLKKWINLLDDNGQIDIVIPCDPGWLFRIGQLIGRNKAKNNYKISKQEIDLILTREHINSSQNLIRIMRYYSDSKPKFFPLLIPVVDFNLFVFFRVKKNQFLNF